MRHLFLVREKKNNVNYYLLPSAASYNSSWLGVWKKRNEKNTFPILAMSSQQWAMDIYF